MSSHHIVREKQEPALLLLSLDNFSDELLGQLLEWSPTVITTPQVAEQLDSVEIKIDVIIADEIDQNLQSDIKQISPAGTSPLHAALNYLIKNEYKAVNIVADEIDIEELTVFVPQINIVVYSADKKIYAINPGFSKWKPAGESIRILSLYLNLRTSGLADSGNGNFTTVADGFFSIDFDGGFLFIAEEV
ncbi:thiamine pyrophosphokinase [Mucilaginibacter lutimaris]|uniref:Thiamine pyrophosphokinase n=1 Tax=Mucilaginibacter lutimaris TaxID=931629 RepID=A0ABW2ZJG0_9SPHI